MQIFEVVYGTGGIAYGGFNSSYVASKNKDSVQGLLNEHEGEDVLIKSISSSTLDASVYDFEQVISTRAI